jgi:7-carboxy-7-deazaguanine synthase
MGRNTKSVLIGVICGKKLDTLMTYSVKEIFYTLQGEGAQTGRPAVFCRFAGCNLWSGLERDRAMAICKFCDTDFVGTDGTRGGKYATADQLADEIASHWKNRSQGKPYVVCTGGEPLLQLDTPLIDALHSRGFEIAVETNGTIAAPEGIDWICVSPKLGANWIQRSGNELKVVWPQTGFELSHFENARFTNFYLQPMDGLDRAANTQTCIETCMANPKWKLSVQTHKMIGVR